MEDNEEPEDMYQNYLAQREEPNINSPDIIPTADKMYGAVSTLCRCETKEARGLFIFDVSDKLQQNEHYDIGGAYVNGAAGLWFYFTTTVCPGYNYLMNLYVTQRQPGTFKIGISNSNDLTKSAKEGDKIMSLGDDLTWFHFSSLQPDSVHYVKTICFSDRNRHFLTNNVLVIPVLIDMNPKSMLNKEMVQRIKAESVFDRELFNDQEADFTLISPNRMEYKVHKVVLAAHSPVLRDAIRAKDCNTYCLNICEKEINVLLEYLYTGTVKDIKYHNFEMLFKLCEKFQLKNLSILISYAAAASINFDNALAIAVVAEKYNCEDIQEIAFKYIDKHPEILESDAFEEIDSANLMKKLLKYVHLRKSKK